MTFCRKWNLLCDYFEATQTYCRVGILPQNTWDNNTSEHSDSPTYRQIGVRIFLTERPVQQAWQWTYTDWSPCSESFLFQRFWVRTTYCVAAEASGHPKKVPRLSAPQWMSCMLIVPFSSPIRPRETALLVSYSFFNLRRELETKSNYRTQNRKHPFHL